MEIWKILVLFRSILLIILIVIRYKAANRDNSPSVVEVEFDIPSNTLATIAITFEKSLLKIAQYKADAERGFDIPPAELTLLTELDELLLDSSVLT